MIKEITVLERSDTWNLIPHPPCTVLIMFKQVYKIKTRSDISIKRYKMCLVLFVVFSSSIVVSMHYRKHVKIRRGS
jgi:hypothetical protein